MQLVRLIFFASFDGVYRIHREGIGVNPNGSSRGLHCKRGLTVEIVVEGESVTPRSRLRSLVDAGASVCVWDSKGKGKRAVCTALFASSEKNFYGPGLIVFLRKKSLSIEKNALVLCDEKTAKRFLDEFDLVKNKYSIPFSEYIK